MNGMTQADLDAIRARIIESNFRPVKKGDRFATVVAALVWIDLPRLLAEVERLNDELRILRPVELQGDAVTSFILAAENSRLTAALDAAEKRAEAAEADLVLAMENSNSLMACEPCKNRGYDPEDGLFCKLKSCKPNWRGPCADAKGGPESED